MFWFNISKILSFYCVFDVKIINISGTSLVVQWLRLHAPNAGGVGLIPGQGTKGFPGGSVLTNLPPNAEDMGSIPRLGRSPGEGNSNPL